MDPTAIAKVWRQADRELWLVSAAAGPRRGGLIATFVMQAALTTELPRVLVGLAAQHHTRQVIDAGGAFGLHLLAEEHLDWVWRFGLETGAQTDKFAGMATAEGVTGAPILADAPAWLECRVEGNWDIGGRVLYVAEIVNGGVRREGKLLTMNRMLELAPAEKLARLRELVRQDSVIEEEAIRRWRRASDSPTRS